MNKLYSIIPIILIACMNGEYKVEGTIELELADDAVTFVIDSVSVDKDDIYAEGHIREEEPVREPVETIEIPWYEEKQCEQTQYEQTMVDTEVRLDSVNSTLDSIKMMLKDRIRQKKGGS